MKHFLVDIETRDGEREYTDHIVVDAKDSDDLEKRIGKIIEKVYSTDEDQHWDEKEGYLDLFETIVSYKGWSEITDPELKVLRKTIYIWHEAL